MEKKRAHPAARVYTVGRIMLRLCRRSLSLYLGHQVVSPPQNTQLPFALLCASFVTAYFPKRVKLDFCLSRGSLLLGEEKSYNRGP